METLVIQRSVSGTTSRLREFKIHLVPGKQMSTRAPQLGNTNRNGFSGGAISCKLALSRFSWVHPKSSRIPGEEVRGAGAGDSPGWCLTRPRPRRTGASTLRSNREMEVGAGAAAGAGDMAERKRGENSGALPERGPTAASTAWPPGSVCTARPGTSPRTPVPGVSSAVKT